MFPSNRNLSMWSTQSSEQSAFECEDLQMSLQAPIPAPVPAEVYRSIKSESWQSTEVNGCWPTSSSSTSVSSEEAESNKDEGNFSVFTHAPSFYTSHTYYSTFDTLFDRRMSRLGCDSVFEPLANELPQGCNSSNCNSLEANSRTKSIYIDDTVETLCSHDEEKKMDSSDYGCVTADGLHHIESLDTMPQQPLKSPVPVSNEQSAFNPEALSRWYLPIHDNQDKTSDYDTHLSTDRTLHESLLPLPHLPSLGYHANRPSSPPFQNPKHCTKRLYLPRYDHREIEKSFSGNGFIDTHCHLDFLFKRIPHNGGFQDFFKTQNFPVSYEGCVAVFCKPSTFAQDYFWKPIIEEDGIWAAFGCHPHHAYDYNDNIHSALVRALEHDKVRALGEIGLDYSDRNKCPKAIQHQVFKRQLKLAIEMALPLVIHNRDAFSDTLEIMKKLVPEDYKIHMHCCMDSWNTAKTWLDTFPNLFIGLTNVITYTSAINVHNIARNIPLDRLLLETDAPYFVPRIVPKSMKWSHPGMAIHVAAQVAALRHISLEEILRAVRRNTADMYGI